MSIRRLLLSSIAVLAALAIGLGAKEISDNRAKALAVDWLQKTNRVSDLAQERSGLLAKERGLTAMLLASSAEAESGLLEELGGLRLIGDRHHETLNELATGIARLAPAHPLLTRLEQLEGLQDTLLAHRALADVDMKGEPGDFETRRWLDIVSEQISILHQLASLSISPLQRNIYTNASQPVIKDVLFALGELHGQERALLGIAIAQGRPLTDIELRQLEHYRANILRAWKHVDGLIQNLPGTPELDAAVSRFVSDLLVDYEDTRRSVLESSERRQPYVLDAGEWYRQATRGIDSVLELSSTVSKQFDRDVGELRQHADRSLMLVLFTFFLILASLAGAMHATRKRVLQPLVSLEKAADAISSGDLSPQHLPNGQDELGRLGRAFEHMRESLVASIRRREADDAEMRKLNKAIEQSVSSVIITDTNGLIEYTNPQFTATTGHDAHEVKGKHVGVLKSGYTPPEQYRSLWDTLLEGKPWKGELLNKRKNGERYWESVSISPICDHDDRITHFISVQLDISERKRIEEKLDFISSYDELTGLPNRLQLNQRFEQARTRARHTGTMIAVVMLGISRFKRINDSLGHEIGDQLLREIGTRLSRCAREQDTVSRLSGSEFAVMLTGVTRREDVADTVKRMIDVVGRPAHVYHHRLQLAMHAGISILQDDGDTLEQLLASAGMALHRVERDRAEHLLFYTPTLNADAHEKLGLENALRTALEADRLELHYQPKVDLASGRVVAAEALVRWRHPDSLEYVPPARFIAVSEETGLIHNLGAWVLREACRQNKQWQDAGLPPIPVAINLSALQLQQRTLPDTIASALQQTGLHSRYLEIELTESAVMENPEEATSALRHLKALGLSIAIDDFGTGYSSLAYLNRFPVDLLKIDRSFIEGIPSDPTSAAIASSVIALAHRMGIRVLAEGVETEEQLAFLTAQSCDQVQGYFFSPPLTPTAFADLLQEGALPPLPPQCRRAPVAVERA